jgi:hypothetical protein
MRPGWGRVPVGAVWRFFSVSQARATQVTLGQQLNTIRIAPYHQESTKATPPTLFGLDTSVSGQGSSAWTAGLLATTLCMVQHSQAEAAAKGCAPARPHRDHRT